MIDVINATATVYSLSVLLIVVSGIVSVAAWRVHPLRNAAGRVLLLCAVLATASYALLDVVEGRQCENRAIYIDL